MESLMKSFNQFVYDINFCFTNFRRGSLYIDSQDRIKKKKLRINSKMDGKCLKYAVPAALNYEEIKWNPERISNIKPFINKYNC